MVIQWLVGIYGAVVVAKLAYASSACIGFSTADDRQKIAAFIRRSKRTGLCPSQLDDFNSLCDTADTQLFTKISHNPVHHVLQALLPPPADRNYNLRDSLHNRQLTGRMSHLTDCNLIVRMLFCDSYWLYCLSCLVLYNFGLTIVLYKHLIWFDLISFHLNPVCNWTPILISTLSQKPDFIFK